MANCRVLYPLRSPEQVVLLASYCLWITLISSNETVKTKALWVSPNWLEQRYWNGTWRRIRGSSASRVNKWKIWKHLAKFLDVNRFHISRHDLCNLVLSRRRLSRPVYQRCKIATVEQISWMHQDWGVDKIQWQLSGYLPTAVIMNSLKNLTMLAQVRMAAGLIMRVVKQRSLWQWRKCPDSQTFLWSRLTSSQQYNGIFLMRFLLA